jgi:hypothetical protein
MQRRDILEARFGCDQQSPMWDMPWSCLRRTQRRRIFGRREAPNEIRLFHAE